MGVHLRVHDAAGAVLGLLPDFVSVEWSDPFIEVGAYQVEYAADGVNAALLDTDTDRSISIWNDGVEVFRGLLEDDERNETGGAGTITAGGRSMVALLNRAIVWPTAVPSQTFTGATPGSVIRTLILDAQARGALTNVTVGTFSATTDSLGNAWQETITRTFPAGEMRVLDVLLRLAEEGLVRWRMVGSDLRLYDEGAYPSDKPAVVLRRGRDIKESRRSRSKRDVQTAMLGVAENGLVAESTSPDAIASYGRREGYEGAGGVNTGLELAEITERLLREQNAPSVGLTASVLLSDPASPRPWADYLPGDVIRSDGAPGVVNAVQVRSIAARVADSHVLSELDLELVGVVTDPVVALSHRVARSGGRTAASFGPLPARVPSRVAPASGVASDGVRVLGAIRQDEVNSPIRARIIGPLTTDAGSVVSVTFPVSFPVGVSVYVTANDFGTSGVPRVVKVRTITSGGFTATIGTGTGGVGSGVSITLVYVAIGTVG